MVYLNVFLTVSNQADAPRVADALRRTGELSRQEEGCVRWECYQSTTESTQFLLVERWQTQEALDKHRKGKAVTEVYLPEVIPLVTRVPHVCNLVFGE